MANKDKRYRFTFEQRGVRGEMVKLNDSWQRVLEKQAYPEVVRQQLGEALASVALLAATIKFKGTLILQIQGDGPLRTLVAQATDSGGVRAMARWNGDVSEGDLTHIYGKGRLVITAESPSGQRYQGIAELKGSNMAAALEHYFMQSEQLPTRLWLSCNHDGVSGLFLQQLPAQEQLESDWEHLSMLADTVTGTELRNLEPEELLYRLFHEESLRFHKPDSLAFYCSCSREKVSNALKLMGREEVESILTDVGQIDVDCEFCVQHYLFDAVDVAALFNNGLEEDQRIH